MKITYTAKIIVDSPEHCDEGELTAGKKYPYMLTIADTKKMLDAGELSVEMILPYDEIPVFIFKFKI